MCEYHNWLKSSSQTQTCQPWDFTHLTTYLYCTSWHTMISFFAFLYASVCHESVYLCIYGTGHLYFPMDQIFQYLSDWLSKYRIDILPIASLFPDDCIVKCNTSPLAHLTRLSLLCHRRTPQWQKGRRVVDTSLCLRLHSESHKRNTATYKSKPILTNYPNQQNWLL